MNRYFSKNKKMPVELHLMIHVLNLVNYRQKREIEKLLENYDIDWDFFLKLVVDRHRVIGPVYKNLIQFAKTLVPEPVLIQLKKRHRQNTLQMMAKTAELVKLMGRFKNDKIKALPFKGPVLGMQLYGNFSMRSSNDLDIAVPKESISHAEKILIKSGYHKLVPLYKLSQKQHRAFIEKRHHFSFFNPVSKINVELHWNFFSNSICSIRFEELWQNRQRVKIGEHHLPACNLDDMLILLLIHGGVHCWRRVFWLYDILLILNRSSAHDWKKLMDRAKQLGVNRPALSALVLLNTLFDFALPESIHEMAKKDKMISFLVRTSIDHIVESDESFLQISFSFNLKSKMARFFLGAGIQYKTRVISNILFPPNFEYLYLPDRFFFLYYLFRPFILFFRKFTSIKPVRNGRYKKET